jgi:putative CocE/NonD family hydrolase
VSDETKPTTELVEETDVMVPMRDGVRMRTDITRPQGEGRFPVLVHRWPYSPEMADMATGMRSLARNGYAVVVQHVRGQFGSEGVFYPSGPDDIDDAYDTIEWAAAQPWSNGKVATYGGSYSGFTQWAAALAQPPHLVAISPVSSTWRYFGAATWYHAPGVMSVANNMSWSAQMVLTDVPNDPVIVAEIPEGTLTMPDRGLDFNARPLRDLAVAPWWKDWCDHDNPNDPYWRQVSAADQPDRVRVPVYQRSGWYDIFLNGTLNAFATLSKFGATERVRRGQRLTVGPWTHLFTFDRPDLVGVEIEPIYEDYDGGSALVQFFDHYLKDESPNYEDEAPLRLFIMGDNIWRDEWEWPLARTEWTHYHLRSGGRANTVAGDGVLSLDNAEVEPPDTYTYNPDDPIPATPALSMSHVGNVDLETVQGRDDVLIYSSNVLETEIEITGPVNVELWASTSEVDTDFTARLVDVFPDDTPVPLCQGVVRARFAQGGPTQEHVTPGAIYRYEIDLWATSNVFKIGHRIRLDISSSEYPTYELNTNTGRRITHDPTGATVSAVQTIFHDRQHPSRVTLPVIPR